ncbi:MAG: RNA pseudouridine synthase [Spirochaetaceae bacterium]|jgi:RluA family pseudouridine synthase|nr:RNA pseudouridine synthase [Spirochaetaceae bacterium]
MNETEQFLPKGRAFFSILYEDGDIVAVNKASGISVGGERWEDQVPRLDRILAKALSGAGETPGPEEARGGARLYTVHRIDKDTSGLVVFAKNAGAHRTLSGAFESRRVEKIYTAVVHGRPPWPGGTILCKFPLLPNGNKRHLTIIDKYRGKPSVTGFRLLLSAGNYSVIEAQPSTGRTHQIRVHLAALGHPVVCDSLYGKNTGNKRGVYLSSFKRKWRGDAFEEKPLLRRLGLHAHRLTLPGYASTDGGHMDGGGNNDGRHTGNDGARMNRDNTGGDLYLEAPLPRDMAALIRQMKKTAGML